MRGYELCLILHPESSEEDIANILDSMDKSISMLKGSILKTENWGKKSLKYNIKKHPIWMLFLCNKFTVITEIFYHS